MAISTLAGVAGGGAVSPPAATKFQLGRSPSAAPALPTEAALKAPAQAPAKTFSQPCPAVSSPGPIRVESGVKATKLEAACALDRVSQAQARIDQVLKLAESGKTFTPAELLALQARVYRASQELDLAGKVVEKVTSGVKQVLQTQV